MTPASFSTTTILGLVGALQGLALALAMISLGRKIPRTNLILAALLATFALAGGSVTLEHAGALGPSLFWIVLEYTLGFLFGPLFLLYAHRVLGRPTHRRFFLHFVPVLIWMGVLGLWAVDWVWPTVQLLPRRLPSILLIMGYMFAYTLIVTILTFKRRSRSWALVSHRRVLYAWIVVMAAVHLAQILRFIFRRVELLENIVPVTGTASIYLISILAFRQSRLFAGQEPPTTVKKYASSNLTEEGAERLEERLIRLLREDQPFLNEDLNLADLALRLGVPRSHLSQVINTRLGGGFSELMVRYRVDHARNLLKDPASQHLTVEAIGYESGFRSRSTFHDHFKRSTGRTPGQFRKELSGIVIEDTADLSPS